ARQRLRFPARWEARPRAGAATRGNRPARLRRPRPSWLLYHRQECLQRQPAAGAPTCQLLNEGVDTLLFTTLEHTKAQPRVEVAQSLVGRPDRGEPFWLLLRRVLLHQLQVAAADRLVVAIGRQTEDLVRVRHTLPASFFFRRRLVIVE